MTDAEIIKTMLQVQGFTTVIQPKQMDQLAARVQAVKDGSHKWGKIIMTVTPGKIEMVTAEIHDEK